MLKDITLGQYYPGDSPVHRMDPRAKLLLTVAYIAGVFLVSDLPGYLLALGFLFAPEKGEKTRKKVMEKLDEWEECLRAEKAAAEESPNE